MKQQSQEKPLLVLVGPTAVGKTPVAIELAQKLDGEIVSADSMQIYRGCDIGTAKPSAKELDSAPHHLIDIREPDETYSAAQWASDAREAIAEIRSRGKLPIIVGGTGFYIKVLLEPDTVAPTPPDPKIRAEISAMLEQHGAKVLWEWLRECDPKAAERLHPNDSQRVARAIEVALASPADVVREVLESGNKGHLFSSKNFALSLSREALYTRIDTRVEEMLAAGFMDELKQLLAQFGENAPALDKLGYWQMRPAAKENGEGGDKFAEGVRLWKRDTRRYAKRQLTWFRHQLPVRWIETDKPNGADEIIEVWKDVESTRL